MYSDDSVASIGKLVIVFAKAYRFIRSLDKSEPVGSETQVVIETIYLISILMVHFIKDLYLEPQLNSTQDATPNICRLFLSTLSEWFGTVASCCFITTSGIKQYSDWVLYAALLRSPFHTCVLHCYIIRYVASALSAYGFTLFTAPLEESIYCSYLT